MKNNICSACNYAVYENGIIKSCIARVGVYDANHRFVKNVASCKHDPSLDDNFSFSQKLVDSTGRPK